MAVVVVCCSKRREELATDTKQGNWRVLVGCILTFGFACRVSDPAINRSLINSPFFGCVLLVLSRQTERLQQNGLAAIEGIYVRMSASLGTPASIKESFDVFVSNLRCGQMAALHASGLLPCATHLASTHSPIGQLCLPSIY